MLDLLLATLSVLAVAQPPVVPKNPTEIAFECPDHDQDTDHRLEIWNLGDGSLTQVLLLGDAPLGADGLFHAPLNVQPVKFGRYRVQVQAVVEIPFTTPTAFSGTILSATSEPVEFERVPGRPGKPVLK